MQTNPFTFYSINLDVHRTLILLLHATSLRIPFNLFAVCSEADSAEVRIYKRKQESKKKDISFSCFLTFFLVVSVFSFFFLLFLLKIFLLEIPTLADLSISNICMYFLYNIYNPNFLSLRIPDP